MQITGMHLVLLKVLTEYYKTHDPNEEPVTQRELIRFESNQHAGLFNEWIEKNRVDSRFCERLTSSSTAVSIIRDWRELGYMSNKRRYIPTPKADELFNKIGESWSGWPVAISVKDGQLDFDDTESFSTITEGIY